MSKHDVPVPCCSRDHINDLDDDNDGIPDLQVIVNDVIIDKLAKLNHLMGMLMVIKMMPMSYLVW